MPMQISDGDLMYAEEYLRKSGVVYGGMLNPNHTARAKDVLEYALDLLKQKTLAERKEKK